MSLVNTEIKPFATTAFHNGAFVPVTEAEIEEKGLDRTKLKRVSEKNYFFKMGAYRDDFSGDHVADLLAISVEPVWRRHGLGRALLDHALHVARATAKAGRLTELRLCVAEDNHRAQRMYERAGFAPVALDVGRYGTGQRAIRMTFPLR